MRIIICTFILLVSTSVLANEELLLDQFFSKSGIKNKSEVYTGEMLEYYLDKPTLGEELPDEINKQYRLLESSDNQSVYAILLSKGEQSKDWYIYLTKDNDELKISAVRNLALPGLFFMGLQELSNKLKRTKEEENQYQNMLLTIKLDSELKEYFNNNIVVFNEVAALAVSNFNAANDLAKTIYLNYVKLDNETGVIDLSIGGMIDNSVGYIFVPSGSKPPRISSEDYIYIEQVANHWYLYKTT